MNKELEKLIKKRDVARKEYNKIINSLDATKLSFYEWQEALEPYSDKISDLNHQIDLITPIEWKEIPDYGDLMTMEDWLDCVESGGFIDYDGSGRYSDGKRMANKPVYPSDVEAGRLLKETEFTHVVWFNR